jgi:non-specific serine/threonine protein kinase
MTEAVAVSEVAGRVPVEVTSFVGRRFERRTIRDLLSEFRLVTLTGFGGVGKTRLAMRLATEVRRAFPDGVCFVPLSALEEADELPDQVADALGLSGRSVQSATDAIVEYLRGRTLLLVLDNCEHVVGAAATLADVLLRNCPTVRILATSREPLRVDGEATHAVAPLSCPVPGGSMDERLHRSEAVQLFVDRARASVPGFAVGEGNREAVEAICRKLEGIPLAIELAAARLTTLSVAELEQGLTDQWELLSRGRRTAPHRQSTMAACIEWSYELCTPAERALWARCSVFVDGFEYDAALVVCAGSDDREPIRETLASLVDKSVLATARGDSTTRFRMLPPIRQRGLAELRRGDEADLQRSRHRDFYVDLVAQAHKAWLSSEQLYWMDRVRRELGNIAEALEYCASDPAAVDRGMRACADLLEFIHVHGLFRQARRWCERLLAASSPDPRSRALALRAAAWWAAVQGDTDAARRLLDEGRALAAAVGGETEVLLTQTAGLVAMYAGELDEAERLLDAAIRGFADDNRAEAAHCWMLLAIAGVLRADPERALGCHRSCLGITEPAGETWLRSWSLWAAGLAEWLRGDRASAQRLLKDFLRLEQLMSETLGIGAAFEATAWVVADTEPERAAVLLGAAQNEWDRIGVAAYTLPGLDVHHRDALDTIRARLGQAGADRAWSRGRSLERAQAVAVCSEQEPGVQIEAADAAKQILTRRERQIADLIHQGLSNKEIAEALVISRRTAEAHVEHILTKLGFTSRTQVAAWVADQRSGREG